MSLSRFSSVLGITVLLIGVGWVQACDFSRDRSPNRRIERADSLYVNSIGIKLRRIPSGMFEMGSRDGEADERPQHEVEITEPFYMSIYEVTQRQWEIVMGSNPSRFRGAHRPVDSVSWYRARDFVQRLNKKEETNLYRLPTEAEWEYAVRGRSKTRFYFGASHDSLKYHAWYSFNSDRRTHRVGRKRGNPFGLYDMYGNVWEWTRDVYAEDFYSQSRVTDPVNTNGTIGARRVIRGGGWFGVVSDFRSANRAWARPNVRNSQLGFRIVREIPKADQ